MAAVKRKKPAKRKTAAAKKSTAKKTGTARRKTAKKKRELFKGAGLVPAPPVISPEKQALISPGQGSGPGHRLAP
jgi:hypothetical protein